MRWIICFILIFALGVYEGPSKSFDLALVNFNIGDIISSYNYVASPTNEERAAKYYSQRPFFTCGDAYHRNTDFNHRDEGRCLVGLVPVCEGLSAHMFSKPVECHSIPAQRLEM